MAAASPLTFSEKDRRTVVLFLLHAGNEPAEIIRVTGLPKSTVCRISAQYEEAGESASPERKMRTSASNLVRTPDFVQRLQALVSEDPTKSYRELATELDVSRTTVMDAIHNDLRCRSYSRAVRHFLSEQQKDRRVERCEMLLSSLKHSAAAGRIRFFSDEKIFTVDPMHNRRNSRWIAADPSEVPSVTKTKHPAHVMVLGVISSEGDVMPPHFFTQNVNKEVYLAVLQDVVKPWIETVTNGRPHVFQQDSAPAHTACIVQSWMEDDFDMFWPKEIWSPSSPDANPLDYCLWGVVEMQANKCRHPDVDHLKAAIVQEMGNLPRTQVVKACERFRPRLEAIIAANGGYIE